MRTGSLLAGALLLAGFVAGTAGRALAQDPAPAPAAAPAAAVPAVSEEAVAYFKTNCHNCHLIGGGVATGPDLKDVTKRRTRAQLMKYVQDPKAAIDSGDPYLVKLWNDAKGVYMPTPPGITPERIASLLDLIEAESALPESKFAKSGVSDRELTPYDTERGRGIFEGSNALKAGGPPCISCHAVDGVGGFGGGRLGPDLTDAFGRLGGRKALAGWLVSPPSRTMAPVFTGRDLDEQEILGLVAYLQDRAVQAGGRPAGGAGLFGYLAAGVGGLVAVLAIFDFLWRGRFRGVRRALVEESRR
jgi:mono/diheme cytochrome c family protein